MRFPTRLHSFLAASCCAAASTFANAQDAASLPASAGAPVLEPAPIPIDSDEADWRFEFTPQIWAMGLTGDLTVRRRTVDVDASFLDVLDASDSVIGLAGRFEVGVGDWSGFIDAAFADIGVEDASGPAGLLDVDVTSEITVIDFGIMYRVGEWPLGNSGASEGADGGASVSLALYGGARYMSASVEVDPALLATRSQSASWIDPIVGAQANCQFSEHWRLTMRGDVGGFGVSSDFTWSAMAVIGFDFSMFDLPCTVFGGYKAIGADYSQGSTRNRFEWDAVLHGPILGLTIRF